LDNKQPVGVIKLFFKSKTWKASVDSAPKPIHVTSTYVIEENTCSLLPNYIGRLVLCISLLQMPIISVPHSVMNIPKKWQNRREWGEARQSTAAQRRRPICRSMYEDKLLPHDAADKSEIANQLRFVTHRSSQITSHKLLL